MMGLVITLLGIAINSYIWCAVGGLLGWAAGMMMGAGGRILLIENVLVGIFGAFIGGEFIAAMLNSGKVATEFKIGSLAIAVATAIVMLLLLRLMRRAVGPLMPGKKKVARRF
jgi:uncharacterized membrane protein YeaQ/YmgE (transglycosylase-associated protein family)